MSSIHHQELGNGHPLVLIHGFCETHEIWEGVATELANDFKVYLPDLPGFGKSPLPKTPFTIDDIGGIMVDWIHGLNLKKVVVVGHSLGGYVALAMAVKDENRMAGLGLFHSTALADTEEKKSNRDKTAVFVKENGVEPFADVFVPGLFYQKTHPSITEVTRLAKGTPLDTLIGYTYAMRDRPARQEWLRTFTSKFLLVGGEFDPILPLEVIAAQSTLARDTLFKTLKNTGHMGMYEAPREASETIKYFSSTCF